MERRQLIGFSLATLLPAPQFAGAQPASPNLKAFTENLPPLNFSTTDSSGGASGFSVELLRMMAAEAGLSLEFQVLPWVRAIRTASEANNSILFSLARLPEREAQYLWVGPISERRIAIYRLKKRDDIRFTGLENLRGLRVGVVRESASAKSLLARGLTPETGLEWGSDDASNLRKLLAGRMDLMVMLDWAAAWNLRQHNLHFDTLFEVGVLDNKLAYWYGLHPNSDPSIAARLQGALDKIKREGRYAVLRSRYFD